MDKEDQIINAVLEIRDDIKDLKREVANKPSIDQIVSLFDEQGQILQRLDQQRLFTLERIKRIEADVEHMKAILKISQQPGQAQSLFFDLSKPFLRISAACGQTVAWLCCVFENENLVALNPDSYLAYVEEFEIGHNYSFSALIILNE